MRVGYVVAALLPVAWASPMALNTFEERDGATVLADLQALDSAAGDLKTTLDSFANDEAPNTNTIIKLQNQNTKVNNAIKKATKDAKASAAFSDADSADIASYTKGTLSPDTIAVINDFIAHYPGFQKAGVVSIVHSSLVQQKKLVQAQAKATTAKLAAPYKGQAPAVTKKIIAAYTKAVNKFSS